MKKRGRTRGDKSIWVIVSIVAVMSFLGFLSSGTTSGYQVAQITPLNAAVEFLRGFGFFNVVLPFLLVFTIVFGVLEKSKLFGTEKENGKEFPRRNLNSIVAFSIAFFVVAASNIIGFIQATIPQVALVLIVITLFLLLFGSLMGKTSLDEGGGMIDIWKTSKGLRTFFVTFIFLAILVIVLLGFGILDDLYYFMALNIGNTLVTSVIFIIIIILLMYYVTRGKSGGKEGKD